MSPSSELHGASLLCAIRACYHIHLVSRNLVNQTTSKATLRQVIDRVFKLMDDRAVGRNTPTRTHTFTYIHRYKSHKTDEERERWN